MISSYEGAISQQTMMDAESNQRSAFRIAAEPLIEDAAATEWTVDAEEPRNLQHRLCFTDHRLSGDPQLHRIVDPENTLGLIAQGFSPSRLSEERRNGGGAAAPPAPRRDGASGHSRKPGAASRRGLETVRRISWPAAANLRAFASPRGQRTRALRFRQRRALEAWHETPVRPSGWCSLATENTEWRAGERTDEKGVHLKLMINLIRDDAQEQCHPSGVEMCAGTRIR